MMRFVIAATLVAATAHADPPPPLALRTIDLGAVPPFAVDESSCTEDRPAMRSQHLVWGGVDVEAYEECGTSDCDGHLAIRHGDATFVTRTTLVAYAAAHMTDAPLRTSMMSDALAVGTLTHGIPALLYRATIRDANICSHAPCADESLVISQFAMVCTLPSAAAPKPACDGIKLACSDNKCPPAALRDGVLTVAGQRVVVTP